MLRVFASFFLLPPAACLLLVITGLLILRLATRTGVLLIALGIFSLWLLSTPVVSSRLHASIEHYPALTAEQLASTDAEVIVVLGAGHYDNAAEFAGQSAPVAAALSRVHYAAYLHRQTGLPLMTTGGPMNRQQDVHAEVLAEALDVYGAPVQWLEKTSATTWQNALFSAEILAPQGIEKVMVVTHSYHMRRAVMLFELAGFEVLPAPTQLSTTYPLNRLPYWLPGAEALDLSHDVLHEYLGLLWYRLVSPVGNASERDLRLAPH
jgi:uncharacterized SAM-binding protein YcdF (DUF218 family)